MPNWINIKKCPIWKVLGVTECDNCDSVEKCWGEEIVMPETETGPKLLEEFLRSIRNEKHYQRRPYHC